MKNKSFFLQFIWFTNYVVAILLLLGYLLPYFSPKLLSKLNVLSLAVPPLIFINFLFFLFWIIKLKRKFLLSAIILVIGYFFSTPLYKFSENTRKSSDKIYLMNYNVRLFNQYNWIKDDSIPIKIKKFIEKENPDILCFQEFHPHGDALFNFPYKYIKTSDSKNKFGQAIYSKYRIVNQGSLNFKNTQNNAIFIDFVKKRDTIRLYNLHIESLGLNPNKENFGQKNKEKILNRISEEFKKQQVQVEKIIEHQKKCKYPILVSGDFNNTAYSWTYRTLKSDFKDSFLEAGKGFGRTFSLKGLPLRIDFIFADKILKINQHKNYSVKHSDHYPIMATIGLD
jgi:endonuclease/exonuclease/phosphatase family metal-dependent hydrolase